MAELELEVARPDERGALENLMQLYMHDFSEQWAGTARGELNDDGRFDPYPLDSCWSDPERTPFLIRKAGRLIGFVLVNSFSHTGRPIDRAVAEFFIVRKHRREGAGEAAAHAVFARWPGQWEAAVARRNSAALAFWRRAAASCPLAKGVEEVDVRSDLWDGPVLRFRIRSP